MSTLLRIHFKNRDFIIQILDEKPSSQSALQVLHAGVVYTFFRKAEHWVFPSVPEDHQLQQELQQIAQTLSLRFRNLSTISIP